MLCSHHHERLGQAWRWFLLAVTLVLSVTPKTDATVVELDMTNFESTLKAHNWTCVIFYDGHDAKKSQETLQLLQALDDSSSSSIQDRVGLARLDIRRHNYYRQAYHEEDDPEPFFERYYSEYPNVDDDNLLGISAATFMRTAGDVYWNSKLLLLGHDLNGYGELNIDHQNADFLLQATVLQRWIEMSTQKPPEEMAILVPSPLQRQLNALEEADDVDNEFDFDDYKVEQSWQQEQKERRGESNDDFVLETGATKNPTTGKAFEYIKLGFNIAKDSTEYLAELSHIIYTYLTWAESYEQLWDNDRKAREDEQTNYGTHLTDLNQKIRALLDKIFQETEESKESAKKQGKMEIPTALKAYLEELVFGVGRSPTTLQAHIQGELVPSLGATAEERRANRKTQAIQSVLIDGMKQHMQITVDTSNNPDRYSIVLADLSHQWHNLLVEFHQNLTLSYSKYLEQQQQAATKDFSNKVSMSVLDMQDSNNADLLSNYKAFHELYTKTGTPVVLSNVNMTSYDLTLDYLIKQCGHADVTNWVKKSPPVGEASSKNWAGLQEYTLERSLVTTSRIVAKDSDDSDSDSDDDQGVDELFDYDETITLEQFVLLSKHVKNLYLHDWNMVGRCDNDVLYQSTLYGVNQTFHIPTVLGAYDLSQRVTLYPFANSWPALFAGTKGTHSKLHVDAGSMGFFLYLVSGLKRWTVYHPSERPYLYSRIFTNSFVPDILGMDDNPVTPQASAANAFLSQRYPLLHRTEQVYEFVQAPGQIVYIPPNCPHAVENIGGGDGDGQAGLLNVGIAMNVIPYDVAFGAHLHHQIHQDREFGYTELALKYKLFEDMADEHVTPSGSKSPLYLTLAEYKAQM